MKKYFFCFLIVLLSGIACLGLSEFLLSAQTGTSWNKPNNWIIDPQIGTWNKGNYAASYRSPEFYVPMIHWNQHGMRDKSRSLEKKQGMFRIGLFGDSFMEALQVADDLTTASLLEKRIDEQNPKVEVLNFSKGGMAATAEYLAYVHKGSSFQLDVVVLAFLPKNDILDNSRSLRRISGVSEIGSPAPFYIQDENSLDYKLILPSVGQKELPASNFIKNLKTYRFWKFLRYVYWAKKRQELVTKTQKTAPRPYSTAKTVEDGVWMPPPTPEWKKAWEITEWVLERMITRVRGDGSHFVLMILPAKGLEERLAGEENRKFNWRYPVDRVLEFGKEKGVSVLDLDDGFLRKMKSLGLHENDLYYPQNRHWKPLAHQLCAELLGEFLMQNHLIPSHPRQ